MRNEREAMRDPYLCTCQVTRAERQCCSGCCRGFSTSRVFRGSSSPCGQFRCASRVLSCDATTSRTSSSATPWASASTTSSRGVSTGPTGSASLAEVLAAPLLPLLLVCFQRHRRHLAVAAPFLCLIRVGTTIPPFSNRLGRHPSTCMSH